ncbi:MAG: hypothetical protein LBR57_03185 [Alistipes sp.]|jgi:hypothetical protein|nr:hypothetical protein [Alistipes sp.]
MDTQIHLLSDSGSWNVAAEFVDSQGRIRKSNGRVVISPDPESGDMLSEIWVASRVIDRHSTYRISHSGPSTMMCDSVAPASKRLSGAFNVDRNMLFLKFSMGEIGVNGYQIAHRNGQVCYVHGAIYRGDDFFQNWTATLTKTD